MLPIRAVLHPTDLTDASRPALEMAGSLAQDYRAELIVLHVLPMPVAAVVDGVAVDLPAGEGEDEAARTRLGEVRPTQFNGPVTRRLERGGAVREILRVADEVGADLIVMGTHGRGGLSRLVLGSTAEGVMRKAPCPVITVRPEAAARPEPAAAAALPDGRRAD